MINIKENNHGKYWTNNKEQSKRIKKKIKKCNIDRDKMCTTAKRSIDKPCAFRKLEFWY